MSNELKPCPFCGGTKLHETSNGVENMFLECEECGADGPAEMTRAKMIAAWNRRAPQAQGALPDLSLRSPALPELPKPDTHCYDEDTRTDVWSHSAEQMHAYAKQYAAAIRAQQYTDSE